MDYGDLNDPVNLANLNLCKIQMEEPGLFYCEPYSADWYAETFPGLPMQCFHLLADAGPIEKTAVHAESSTTVTRRRRSRGGRRARMRRQRQFNLSLSVIPDVTNSDGYGSES